MLTTIPNAYRTGNAVIITEILCRNIQKNEGKVFRKLHFPSCSTDPIELIMWGGFSPNRQREHVEA